MTLPPIVPEPEWQEALDAVNAKEKELTRAHDALAAERRRLPRVRIEKDYVFDGPAGKARLVDLFEGRRQLALYHFMFGPSEDAGCVGCSMFTDQVAHVAHLNARDTSFALVSRAPIEKLEAYRMRMGWELPWYSSFESDFNPDFGRGLETPDPTQYQDGEMFGLSVFVREGDESVPDVLHDEPRRGGDRPRLDVPRPDPAGASGGVGGLAGGLPADAAVRLVAPARRVRVLDRATGQRRSRPAAGAG